ncbi:hydrophobic surface binding protein, partial [Mycena pura]
MASIDRKMVQLSLSLFVLSLFAVSFTNPVKRTVAQVESDIATISTQLTSLDNDIKGFPASGLVGALNIHSAAGTLDNTLNSATTDVTATGTVDVADGTTILNAVQAFVPTIQDATTRISGDKAAFAAQPIGGLPALVLSDLKALNASTIAFANALIAGAPVRNR